MLGTAVSLSLPGAFLSFFGLILLLASGIVYFKNGAGKELIEQQDKTLAMQAMRLDEQEKMIGELKVQNTQQAQQLSQQAQQLRTLSELVTQAAKVDDLTKIVKVGFEHMGVKW